MKSLNKEVQSGNALLPHEVPQPNTGLGGALCFWAAYVLGGIVSLVISDVLTLPLWGRRPDYSVGLIALSGFAIYTAIVAVVQAFCLSRLAPLVQGCWGLGLGLFSCVVLLFLPPIWSFF